MFKTRLLSGILLVIIALITVITGGSLLFGVLLLISLIGMTELYKYLELRRKLRESWDIYLQSVIMPYCILSHSFRENH